MNNYKITKLVRSHTDDELLGYLKRVADANDGRITQSIYAEYRKSVDPTIAEVSTICRQIGWNKALTLIGVDLNKYQDNKKVTKEELLEEIFRLWTLLGRQPTTTDLKKGLSKYSRNRFNIFGSWKVALNKFIEWINNEDFVPTIPIAIEQNEKHKTNRDINLRLRFKVMQRDNFKCCICGVSPATDSRVILHIDHIIPWSKYGESTMENLQTLCQKCNLGKSDFL